MMPGTPTAIEHGDTIEQVPPSTGLAEDLTRAIQAYNTASLALQNATAIVLRLAMRAREEVERVERITGERVH